MALGFRSPIRPCWIFPQQPDESMGSPEACLHARHLVLSMSAFMSCSPSLSLQQVLLERLHTITAIELLHGSYLIIVETAVAASGDVAPQECRDDDDDESVPKPRFATEPNPLAEHERQLSPIAAPKQRHTSWSCGKRRKRSRTKTQPPVEGGGLEGSRKQTSHGVSSDWVDCHHAGSNTPSSMGLMLPMSRHLSHAEGGGERGREREGERKK